MKITSTILCGLSLALFWAVESANAQPVLPDFATAIFLPGAPVDTPYFPLIDKTTRIFTGEKEEDGKIVTERFELTNMGPGPNILGIQTTTQRDRSFEDGVLVEDTLDYYAQDTDGNVWYMGEDVTNYIYDDEGNLTGTNSESAWKAGVNNAKPGYIMPVNMTIGFKYYQEFAPADEALDQGEIFQVGETIHLATGTFDNVLRIFETNELEPDAREFKYYAPGVGLIKVEEDLNEELEDPELTFEPVATAPVPEPASLLLIGFGLAGLALFRRKTTPR